MAPVYGWKSGGAGAGGQQAVYISSQGDNIAEDLNTRLKKNFLATLCRRPARGVTEVRRDNKDTVAVAKVIKKEFVSKMDVMDQQDFINHMHAYASAAWATMESVHQLMLDDEIPENERSRLDPDHWYEINLTNAVLFSNLYLEHVPGLEQLVPGRLFSTRMPRDIVLDLGERTDFIKKCQVNKLRVVFVLTEPHEFKKYSGMDGLLEFYKQECGLTVYNRAIPDFQIPTQVKSTYVETKEQEIFLKNMPRAIDSRIVAERPHLARAIAAEHLIQVFFTHKSKIEKQSTEEDRDAVRQSLGDNVEPLDQREEDELLDAYKQTFDLIDSDGSGTLETGELEEWFRMCGAELDLSTLLEVLVGGQFYSCDTQGQELTRDKFARLMCSSAKSHRRDYDIGDEGEAEHGH